MSPIIHDEPNSDQVFTEMSTIDFVVIGIALFGMFWWIRGCRRRSLSDCLLGLVFGILAGVLYFFLFNLTRTSWLAAILLGVFLLSFLPFRGMLGTVTGRMLAVGLVLLMATAAVAEYHYVSAGNSLLVIEPYRAGKGWEFDEPRLGLQNEPFVEGIPEMIDKLVAGLPGSDKQVRLIFSQRPFPGAQLRLDRRREENGGNWYFSKDYQKEGWLCPALFKFFPRAPRHIYVKAEPK